MPRLCSPNAITLSGFAFVVANFCTLLWYNPTLDQDCPPWVYASWAIGLFLYQTFDAVDGTQARRTGQSGPLGELFDHGVDALNTVLEVLLFAGATNLGQSWSTMITLFASAFTFYVQTWDEYYTQTLTLGLISGPVEGILTLCLVYAFTAFVGRGSFWQQSMLETIGVPDMAIIPDFLYELPFAQWWLVYGGVVLVFNTVQRQASLRTMFNDVLTCPSAKNVMEHQKNAAPHTKSDISPLVGLVPAAAFWTLTSLYLYLQPIILNAHLIPFVFYVGLINAYMVGKIIVAHLTKSSHFPYRHSLMFPLAIGVIDSLGPKLGLFPSALGDDMYQVAFMFMCLGLGMGVYGSFVVS